MRISRRFTAEGQSPYAGIEFAQRTSEIRNPDGTTVFRQEGLAAPAEWSSVAVDILAQKYFRKSGVPQVGPDHRPLLGKDGQPVVGGERDARQVFHRLAGCWTHWGERYGYFDSPTDARASTTNSATCSRPRSPPPTRRSGSTRASTTPTASPAPPKATTTWIPTRDPSPG